MTDYDPLILRDQLAGQVKHAVDSPDPEEALWYLIEYLNGVIDDITNWDDEQLREDNPDDLHDLYDELGAREARETAEVESWTHD